MADWAVDDRAMYSFKIRGKLKLIGKTCTSTNQQGLPRQLQDKLRTCHKV
jgi:hypothetical protein